MSAERAVPAMALVVAGGRLRRPHNLPIARVPRERPANSSLSAAAQWINPAEAVEGGQDAVTDGLDVLTVDRSTSRLASSSCTSYPEA
jgi:hypothetical protein